MLKNKKGFLALAAIGVAFLLYAGGQLVLADNTVEPQSRVMLNPISLLGVGVVRGDVVMNYIDNTNATTTYDVFLPALSSVDGDIYIYKSRGSGYTVSIHPASGEAIDLDVDRTLTRSDGAGGFAVLVADETNETWWVISYGSNNLE